MNNLKKTHTTQYEMIEENAGHSKEKADYKLLGNVAVVESEADEEEEKIGEVNSTKLEKSPLVLESQKF